MNSTVNGMRLVKWMYFSASRRRVRLLIAGDALDQVVDVAEAFGS